MNRKEEITRRFDNFQSRLKAGVEEHKAKMTGTVLSKIDNLELKIKELRDKFQTQKDHNLDDTAVKTYNDTIDEFEKEFQSIQFDQPDVH